jgi:Mg2+ and Co2+ transporter CorA
MIASVDNQIMKSITLLTMVFLPATFTAVSI